VPLTVPVMNRVDTFCAGDAAAHVPPVLGPDVPSVTVKVPAPLTESVIVPVGRLGRASWPTLAYPKYI